MRTHASTFLLLTLLLAPSAPILARSARASTVASPSQSIDRVRIFVNHGDIELVGADTSTVRIRTLDTDVDTEAFSIERGSAGIVSISQRPGTESGNRYAFEVPRLASLDLVEVKNGDLSIRNISGSVRLKVFNGDCTVDSVGDLDARVENGDLRMARVTGGAYIESRSGDVTANEVSSGVVMRVESGDVLVDSVGGRIEASMTSGDLRISRAGAGVRAATISGSIVLGDVSGLSDVATASGDIVIRNVTGDVEARTTSGDVTFVGSIQSDGKCRLKSLSGDVYVCFTGELPGFRASLSTFNGTIETDIPLTVDRPLSGLRNITGRYGNGRAEVVLESFNGLIRMTTSCRQDGTELREGAEDDEQR